MFCRGPFAFAFAVGACFASSLSNAPAPHPEILRLSGTTNARSFASILAPVMRAPDAGRQLTVVKLVKSGSHVTKGEVIAEIDTQALRDHVDDINSQVLQADADVKKRSAEQEIEMENLRQQLRVAKANLEKAKFDLKASPIRADIDQEILRLSVEEAQATLKQTEAGLALTAAKQKAEIRILELTRERHKRHRDRHAHDVTVFSLKAPISGLAVMLSIWRGGEMGQVQQGEQINPGQPFMRIVDTSRMLLEATVNQAESEKIHIGQSAEVRIDAFPYLRLPGHIESVGALGVGGWRENYYVRNVTVRVRIEGSDPHVIPDLSGSADVNIAAPVARGGNTSTL